MKRFFAAANSCTGFVNYFESIFQREEWEKIYLIKGGSGVGKSTALRRIGKFFMEQGWGIEEILCSSDPRSLDGINIPKLKITFLDATAPHAMEATMPVALEEIIDFAQFLDEKNLREKKEVIRRLLQKKKMCYVSCYEYLKCANELMVINEKLSSSHIDVLAIEKMAKQIGISILEEKEKGQTNVKNRRLFAEAFNADGISEVGADLLNGLDVYAIQNSNEYASDTFMSAIVTLANSLGYSAEIYLSVFNPDKIKMVIIEERGVAFSSYQCENCKIIDSSNWESLGVVESKEEVEGNLVLIKTILVKAKQWLIKAKSEHEKLEKIYSANMDFVSLDNYILELLKPYRGR